MTDTKADNVYKKLANIRVELQKMDLKKSGKNNHAGFSYYELQDFLPAINELNQKYGLLTVFSIGFLDGVERAYLKILDINTGGAGDYIEFEAPTAEVEIGVRKDGTGGAQPIQNQGGKITYMRRYLYMMAYEIVEQDSVDASPIRGVARPKSTASKAASKTGKSDYSAVAGEGISLKQREAIMKISEQRGEPLSWEDLEGWTKGQASEYISNNGNGGYYKNVAQGTD